jgi:hypothetical protein
MNRRSFLSLFAGAAAASTVSYFLPPIGGWKSDVIVNPYPAFPPKSELDAAMARLNAYWDSIRSEAQRIFDDPRNLEIAAQQMGIPTLHTFDGLYPLQGYLHVDGGRHEYAGLA